MNPPLLPLERRALMRSRQLLAAADADGARRTLLQALAREPNLPRVHLALARLRWPGPDYRQWLGWLQGFLQPRVYLEIGVESGRTLALARPPTRAVGVDPRPHADALAHCAVPTQLHAMTSADFLRAPPLETGLGSAGFDLAFIDGDHRFATVLDDFIGVEALAAPGAVVVLHDMLPVDAATAAAQPRTGFYSGDGWKLVPCLRALRPDLRVVTIPAAPTGLTMVTGLRPDSSVLRERRAAILDAYAALDAARVVDRPDELMALGVNDLSWGAHWLQDARARSHS